MPDQNQTLADVLGKDIYDYGMQLIDHQAQTFGDPKEALWRKTRISDMLLRFAGVNEGQPFTPRVHAALKLGEQAVAILMAKEPSAVLGDAMATIAALAPVEALHHQMQQEASEKIREQDQETARMVNFKLPDISSRQDRQDTEAA